MTTCSDIYHSIIHEKVSVVVNEAQRVLSLCTRCVVMIAIIPLGTRLDDYLDGCVLNAC